MRHHPVPPAVTVILEPGGVDCRTKRPFVRDRGPSASPVSQGQHELFSIRPQTRRQDREDLPIRMSWRTERLGLVPYHYANRLLDRDERLAHHEEVKCLVGQSLAKRADADLTAISAKLIAKRHRVVGAFDSSRVGVWKPQPIHCTGAMCPSRCCSTIR